MSGSVALVLDPNFGDRVSVLAMQMPVWIISSPTNDRAVQEARGTLSGAQITILITRARETPEYLLARFWYDIDEHHGLVSELAPYDTLWVYGPIERMPHEVATELGFGSITRTKEGFIAER